MDLTIPYTFYPTALPHGIAWLLFLIAVAGGTGIGLVRGRRKGWLSGVGTGIAVLGVLIVGTMLASMVITFFLHDL